MIGLRNKIAQMLIMGFNGSAIREDSPIAQWLNEDGLGGVILFDKDIAANTYGKNLKSQAQIRQLTQQLNEYARRASSRHGGLPLFIAIDYEGGAVDRLSQIEGCGAPEHALDLARCSASQLDEVWDKRASTLKSLGFNLNFAPVLDLHFDEEQGIIGALKRSFSDDPEVVIRLARQFVHVFSRYGIACAYKHFPGHGSAVGDTHKRFVDVTDTFLPKELAPYEALVRDSSKPVMIMTAHVINRHLDDSGLPATLSQNILQGLLRDSLGFEGVLVSDDLQMQAISKEYSIEEAVCKTINAGADMMIIANQLGETSATQVIDKVEQCVKDNTIKSERIDEAFHRIMRLKQQMHCMEAADLVK